MPNRRAGRRATVSLEAFALARPAAARPARERPSFESDICRARATRALAQTPGCPGGVCLRPRMEPGHAGSGHVPLSPRSAPRRRFDPVREPHSLQLGAVRRADGRDPRCSPSISAVGYPMLREATAQLSMGSDVYPASGGPVKVRERRALHHYPACRRERRVTSARQTRAHCPSEPHPSKPHPSEPHLRQQRLSQQRTQRREQAERDRTI
jgi:hypothetical protein